MQSRSSVLSRSLLASLVLLTTACGDATSGGGDDDVSVTADTAVGADAVTAWSSGVVASPSTVEASVGALASASKVAVGWEAPDESVDHFVVTQEADKLLPKPLPLQLHP